MADKIEEWPRGTERLELDDIEIADDGSLVRITRVQYQRATDRMGYCPFCQSKDGVEFVDEVGPGGTYRKQRYECECGAYGEGVWTWKAGLKEDPQSGEVSPELTTDGGIDMTEWECGGCGDSFETPGEPELPCLKCGTDDWQEVDA